MSVMRNRRTPSTTPTVSRAVAAGQARQAGPDAGIDGMRQDGQAGQADLPLSVMA